MILEVFSETKFVAKFINTKVKGRFFEKGSN